MADEHKNDEVEYPESEDLFNFDENFSPAGLPPQAPAEPEARPEDLERVAAALPSETEGGAPLDLDLFDSDDVAPVELDDELYAEIDELIASLPDLEELDDGASEPAQSSEAAPEEAPEEPAVAETPAEPVSAEGEAPHPPVGGGAPAPAAAPAPSPTAAPAASKAAGKTVPKNELQEPDASELGAGDLGEGALGEEEELLPQGPGLLERATTWLQSRREARAEARSKTGRRGAPRSAFNPTTVLIALGVTVVNAGVVGVVWKNNRDMRAHMESVTNLMVHQSEAIGDRTEEQLRTLDDLAAPIATVQAGRLEAFTRAEEALRRGDTRTARRELYALLAVADRFGEKEREELEARAAFGLADAWRFEARAAAEEAR